MTKEEVRAISLDKLELHRAKRMLDVGSGTGSVTIQAARTYPELEVVAVERNEDAVALTQENIQHFGCHNVRLHQGLAPIELEGSFDAIFVGGTGGNMHGAGRSVGLELYPAGECSGSSSNSGADGLGGSRDCLSSG